MGNCREKNCVSAENSEYTHYQILVLFIVFGALSSTYKLDGILNSSSFLQYLVTTLQTNISNLLKLSFSPTPTGWFDVNFRQITTMAHVRNFCACFCGGHPENSPKHLMTSTKTFKLQTRKVCQQKLPSSFHTSRCSKSKSGNLLNVLPSRWLI